MLPPWRNLFNRILSQTPKRSVGPSFSLAASHLITFSPLGFKFSNTHNISKTRIKRKQLSRPKQATANSHNRNNTSTQTRTYRNKTAKQHSQINNTKGHSTRPQEPLKNKITRQTTLRTSCRSSMLNFGSLLRPRQDYL